MSAQPNDAHVEPVLWWNLSDPTLRLTTGEIHATGYTTAAGVPTCEIIGYFKRMQYVTSYQMATTGAITLFPKRWKLSLSNDGGLTWKHTDEREYSWLTPDRQTWDVSPGFYNAYKLEVLENHGGNSLRIQSFRLIGLPTELIPVATTETRNDMNIGYSLATNSPSITQPYGSSATIAPNGYIDYTFRSPKKARSFSIWATTTAATNVDPMTSWDVLGSHDGDHWDVLYSARNVAIEDNVEAFFNLEKVACYRKYRLKPVGNEKNVQVFYFQLYRTGSPTNPSHPYDLMEMRATFDPTEEIDLEEGPSLPLNGEGVPLFVSPNVANIVTRTNYGGPYINVWLFKGKQSTGAAAAEYSSGEYGYWYTTNGQTTGFFEIHFLRTQYITAYEVNDKNLSKQLLPRADLPREWKFYVSKDDGENWILAHSATHEWSDSEKLIFDITPGFYNAYKFEVLSVNGGNRVQMGSVNAIGVTTELFPNECTIGIPPTTNVYYGCSLAYRNGLNTDMITDLQPYNGSWIYVNGFIDYIFIDKRKARSFLINGTITGFDVLGSNDGTNWDTVLSVRDATNIVSYKEDAIFPLDKPGFYRRYRFKPVQPVAQVPIHYIQLYR